MTVLILMCLGKLMIDGNLWKLEETVSFDHGVVRSDILGTATGTEVGDEIRLEGVWHGSINRRTGSIYVVGDRGAMIGKCKPQRKQF